MPTIEFRSELFNEDAVATEEAAFRLLKAGPVDQVNYFAAPWSALIRRRELAVPRLRLGGGFTVCQHAWFDRIIPACLHLGLDTLFTPHVQPPRRTGVIPWLKEGGRTLGIKRLLRTRIRTAGNLRILPFPHLAVNGADPQPKELWYSFVGCDTHPIRRVILDLPQRSDTLLKLRKSWHFDVAECRRQEERREYQDTLARSRFSLCPRGYGGSTIRFWESLQAGAIPVLISDSMVLPDGYDWESCVVWIAEHKVAELEYVLRGITPAAEERMRQSCLTANGQFSGANFVSCIRATYLAGARPARPESVPK